jgi:hypothetical protein
MSDLPSVRKLRLSHRSGCHIPRYDDEQETLVTEDTDEDDRNEETAEDDPSIAASGKS